MKLDLTDAELDELDALLAETPAPLQAMDVAMLDGYLCGVIVQPQAIAPELWLPAVFDVQGRPLPPDVDARWLSRVKALLLRRQEALGRALDEEGAFTPVVPTGEDEPDDPALRDALRELPQHSRVLFAWALGFQSACVRFPGLVRLARPAVDAALARVLRHLPPATAQAREATQALDQAVPLANEDAAVDDVVMAVSELWELTQDDRLHVATVRRSEPKVGRNDPCPCGSGRKFKQCHGA